MALFRSPDELSRLSPDRRDELAKVLGPNTPAIIRELEMALEVSQLLKDARESGIGQTRVKSGLETLCNGERPLFSKKWKPGRKTATYSIIRDPETYSAARARGRHATTNPCDAGRPVVQRLRQSGPSGDAAGVVRG